jgi:hypothetical protein
MKKKKENQILVRVASNSKPNRHKRKQIHCHNILHSLTQKLQELTLNSVNLLYRPSTMNLQREVEQET